MLSPINWEMGLFINVYIVMNNQRMSGSSHHTQHNKRHLPTPGLLQTEVRRDVRVLKGANTGDGPYIDPHTYHNTKNESWEHLV